MKISMRNAVLAKIWHVSTNIEGPPSKGPSTTQIQPSTMDAPNRLSLIAAVGILSCLSGWAQSQNDPITITNQSPTADGNLLICWEGAIPPYQLQFRTNSAGSWSNTSPPLYTNCYVTPLAPDPVFYRVVPILDTTPPPPPTGLQVLVIRSNEITLAWGASPCQDVPWCGDNPGGTGLAGYRIYFGFSSRDYPYRIDVGNVSSATILDLTPGTTYFFALTAYDKAGLESDIVVAMEMEVAGTTLAVSGGPSRISPFLPPDAPGTYICTGFLTVQLEPDMAVQNGAAWRVDPLYTSFGKLNNWTTSTQDKIVLNNGELAIEFRTVPHFESPIPPSMALSCDLRSNLVFYYKQILPSLSISKERDLTLIGITGRTYSVQHSPALGKSNSWATLGTYTLPANSNKVVVTDAALGTNGGAGFFRAMQAVPGLRE